MPTLSLPQILLSSSPLSTRAAGARCAQKILREGPREKGAVIVALEGNLGSGKTTFLQGFARGLGVREKILSPTFILMRKFKIQRVKSQKSLPLENLKFKNFYHIDCYRIRNERELFALDFKKIISEPRNIVAIEWADRIKNAIPQHALRLRFSWRGKREREIRIVGGGGSCCTQASRG